MKQYISLLFALVICSPLFGQTGYYGNRSSLAFEYGLAPSVKMKSKIRNVQGDSILVRSARLVNSSYGLSYNRIINNKLSLGVGYGYSNVKVSTNGLTFGNQEFFTASPTASYHNFALKLKYFRFGNINPVGKYIGFILEGGRTRFRMNDYGYILDQNIVSSSRTKSKYDIISFVQTNDSLSVDKFNTYFLKFAMGRNIPINKQTYVSLETSFNAVGVAYSKSYGYQFSRVQDLLDDMRLYPGDPSKNNRNFTTVMNSVFSYRRFVFNVGFHYTF